MPRACPLFPPAMLCALGGSKVGTTLCNFCFSDTVQEPRVLAQRVQNSNRFFWGAPKNKAAGVLYVPKGLATECYAVSPSNPVASEDDSKTSRVSSVSDSSRH